MRTTTLTTTRVISATIAPLCLTAVTSADELIAPAHPRSGPPVITLYDNGDPDGENGYSNATSGVFGFRRTLLDDFVVPSGEMWFIEGMRWNHVWGTPSTWGGQGIQLTFRSDAAGAPGAAFDEIELTGYSETFTGNLFFSRQEVQSFATFETVALPAGHYWFEGTMIGPENNFWLTAPLRNRECWVDYEDLGGLQTGTEQFGVASDISWKFLGRDSSEPAACCFADGACSILSLADCIDAGGTFLGTGIACSPTECRAPGACCFADGACVDATDLECEATGGFFGGYGTACGPIDCTVSGFCFRPDAIYPIDDNAPSGAIALGDLDGANGPDLVTINPSQREVAVRLNDGSGAFGHAVRVETVFYPIDVEIADLDNDTDRDVAVLSEHGEQVVIHFNDGTGALGPFERILLGTTPRDLNYGDFDADLDLDLVVIDDEAPGVLILLNDGTGAFAPPVGYETAGTASVAVSVADVDGDLDLDLVVANRESFDVSVLLNNGNGTFAPAVVYPVQVGPRTVVARDLDGDLDRDIVVAGAGDGVGVLKNNGDGTFTGEVRYEVGFQATQIALLDHAGDGTGDLVVAKTLNRVTVLINDGAGAFLSRVDFPAGRTPEGVAVGDFEGDGDLDFAVVNTSGPDIGIFTFFNDCVPCPGDVDHSGAVDFADIVRILAAWGMTGVPEDLDGSGTVDFGDLVVLLAHWGPCPSD